MISRSDGRNFHLLLADRPLPYPAENDRGPTEKLSIFFSYSYAGGASTHNTIVLVPATDDGKIHNFRQIEFIADLLAAELLRSQTLAPFYDLQGNSLHEIAY